MRKKYPLNTPPKHEFWILKIKSLQKTLNHRENFHQIQTIPISLGPMYAGPNMHPKFLHDPSILFKVNKDKSLLLLSRLV